MHDIRSVAPEQAEKIESVRSIFNKADQELTEEVKYGGLVFFKSGTLIGGIFLYKKHISVEFSYGADFSDPSGLLEGKGKKRRHLKLLEEQDIDKRSLAFFIKQAIALAS